MPGWQIQFIVQDQDFGGLDAVELHQGPDRLAAAIHERLQQQKPEVIDARLSSKTVKASLAHRL